MVHKERKDAVRRNYMFNDFVPGGDKDIGLEGTCSLFLYGP